MSFISTSTSIIVLSGVEMSCSAIELFPSEEKRQ